MSIFKIMLSIFLFISLGLLVLPVFAVNYTIGVTAGQYVKYGNFVGSGPGYESFNDYNSLNLQVTSVSGSSATLLSTGQFKNGTALPGNGSVDVWDIVAGTDNGTPSTQGPIIAANLNQGDSIPPPNTYTINQTAQRTYLGVARSVNILNVSVSTPDYNSTLNYVYDKTSGMLLESTSTTTTDAQPTPITSTYSYSIVATNIFGTTPSNSIPELNSQAIVLVAIALTVISVSLIVLQRKNRLKY